MNGDGKIRLCPFFDQGAGLLADITIDYPPGEDPIGMIGEVKGKTICQSFEDALDAAEQLYGYHLKFLFTGNDVKKLLENIPIYSDEEKGRVETVVLQQMHKYRYLF